ncbi:cAMP-dependent protein kinase type I-alpha regulatory subunit-like [Topomyia yanbarensis]|uniref:cAMP-dependent protein kinase type I-alpha regulatory subunit-like n=1 Tax=Topomyia yanbarensis TaxID=2498891 RepID=UPI00273C6FDB|nr:cAMP-dependent protein kinase type I-alpha regulatory subunit-like [Topomyia yanbarensis]
MASKKRADEEKLRRRRVARFRFKALVRLVICNNYWLSDIDEQEIGENARRNIALIVRRKGKKGLLTLLEKAILNQRAEDRTQEQILKLNEVFRKLECLSHFPVKVREQLAACARYLYYSAGRTIIRQGQQPLAVYFVLDGEITVSRLQWDPIYKKHVDVLYGVRVPGEMFGEIAFLYGCPRTTTCVSATDCELLCVLQDDFERLLEPTLRLQWNQMMEALRRFQYFDHWSEDQIRECCILAKVNDFNSQQQIAVCGTGGNFEYAYFVLSGQCMILQCLKVKKKMNGLRECYRLLPSESDERQLRVAERLMQRKDSDVLLSVLSPKLRASLSESVLGQQDRESCGGSEDTVPEECVEHHFIDVGSYSCGSVFGLGERMEDRSIVARNHVQCMLIPRYWLFMKHQNTGNVWQRIKMYLEMAIPSREQLFKQFLDDLNWLAYRKKVVNEIVQRRGRQNHTRLIDVPIVCRVEQSRGPN